MQDQPSEARAALLAFGARVRALRQKAGLTQEQLAHAAGLHRAEVGFIERAEREPGITIVLPLATALGVNPGELFT